MKHLALLSALLLGVQSLIAKPNVVVIIADDQGWGDLSGNGNTNIHTPNIDRLSEGGAHFERFFVSPVCSPTRAEFLTGRYHPRSGVSKTSSGMERMDLDEETIAEVMKRAGYRTGLFGKWHNGTQHPYHPNSRGFEEYYGFTSGHLAQYFDSHFLDHNGEIVTGKGFIIDDVTDHAMGYIKKSSAAGEPFFVCLTYNTPHTPMQVPDRFWKDYVNKEIVLRAGPGDDEDLDFTRASLAMSENIDWNVGRVMAQLDKLGLSDDTIVVYLSDNGPDTWRWNGGMKGKKGMTDEGGVRSPLIVRWPSLIKPRSVVREIASVIDLRPTLTELCGIQATPAKPLDGISLKSEVLGGRSTAPNRILYSHWAGKVSARTQQYRFGADGALYDMVADPGQKLDVSSAHPQIASQLRMAVGQWRKDVLSELILPDTRPYVVGHPDGPCTQLPARDADLHGGLKRSNHFPNSSFVTNWKDPADYLSWNVSVSTGGLYRAEIYYACPAADVGSTIKLSFRDSIITGRVDIPTDPTMIGPSDDRYPRSVSVDKMFRTLELGTLLLKQGEGELRLSAPKIAHNQALELRLLVLRKVKEKSAAGD